MSVLGIIIAAALTIFYDEVQAERAERQGVILQSNSAALLTYQSRFATELVQGNVAAPDITIAGVTFDRYRPTFDNLMQIGILPAGGANNNLYGGTYVFQLTKFPAGCTDLSPSCEIVGVAALSNSIVDFDGNVNYSRAGQIALAAGDAGTTTLGNLGTLTGPNGSWLLPHPAGNVAAGVGARTISGIGGLNAYLRRDGGNFMTGPLRLNDPANPGGTRQNVIGVGDIDALSGTIQDITSNSIDATTLDADTGTIANLTSTTSNLGTASSDSLNNAQAIQTGNLRATGSVVAQDYLVARDVFLTERGVWAGQLLPNVALLETNLVDLRIAAARNVTKPNCTAPVRPGTVSAGLVGTNTNTPQRTGLARIYVYPVSGVIGSVTEVAGTIEPNGLGDEEVVINNSRLALGSFDVQVVDNGATWSISYETLSEIDGTSYNNNAFALVQVACAYNN